MLKHNLHTINKSLIKDETEVLEHNHRSMKKDEMGTKCASKLGRPVGLTCIVIDSWWDFQESSTSQFLTNTPCCTHPSTKMEGKCIIVQTILKEKKIWTAYSIFAPALICIRPGVSGSSKASNLSKINIKHRYHKMPNARQLSQQSRDTFLLVLKDAFLMFD